jgi:hypothetical protein
MDTRPTPGPPNDESLRAKDRHRAAESSSFPQQCANCDADLAGPFCSRCGQRNTNLAVSIRVLARDFADEYLSLDSRLFRSAISLLFRPGFLTRQYLIGRRERFVRPLRLYLVSSLAFFFTLSLVARPSLQFGIDAPDASIRELLEQSIEQERPVDDDGTVPGPGTAPADPTVLTPADAPAEDARAGPTGAWSISVAERIETLGNMSPRQLGDALVAGFERQLPRTMFVLLPAFALILKLLYLRRHWYYAEHFVFTLHFHAFAFTIFLLLLLLPDGWWTTWVLLWGVLYLFLSMHRVYRQSIWRTALKFSLLTSVYATLLVLAIVASAVFTLLLV